MRLTPNNLLTTCPARSYRDGLLTQLSTMNILSMAGKAAGLLLFLGVVYFSFRFIWKDSIPNFFYKGWGSLQPAYAVEQLPAQRFITSVRVGSDVYQGTMYVALDEQGVYFQRTLLEPYQQAMYIPYSRFKLLEKPKARQKLFSLGTYAIFDVDGVDIWLDNPYAAQIIAHLKP
jgi:hypothetical protein